MFWHLVKVSDFSITPVKLIDTYFREKEMKLLTKEIIEKLPKLYSQDEVKDPICHLKYFTPDSGWTWFILEGTKQDDGDWLFFCNVISPICPEGELGYVSLNELKQVTGPLGLPIERDLYWKSKPLSECH